MIPQNSNLPDSKSYVRWLRERIDMRKVILTYVTTLIEDEHGRLLWQRRSDFAWWGLPGGVLEIGETFLECARREAREETGLEVEPHDLLGVYAGPQYEVTYPNGDEVQQCTVALHCRITGGQLKPDGQESTDLRFFPPHAPPDDCPRWYADMAAQFVRRSPTPSFEAPLSVAEPASTIFDLRTLTGPTRLITVGAGALIRDEVGRVLLGLRSDSNLWGIPAGLMELGETPAGTIVREAREELGIKIKLCRLVGVFTGPEYFLTYPDGNQVQIVSIIFAAQWVGDRLVPDQDETLEAGFFSPDALPPMVGRHERLLRRTLTAGPAGVFE